MEKPRLTNPASSWEIQRSDNRVTEMDVQEIMSIEVSMFGKVVADSIRNITPIILAVTLVKPLTMHSEF